MSLKVFCGQEQNAIDSVHKMGESLLKTVVVTSAQDVMTLSNLISDCPPIFIIADQSMGRGAIRCAMPVAWRQAAVGWYGGADGSMA